MIAKYDGACFISGQTITAGESEIEQRSGRWCLAEFATREAFQNRMETAAEEFASHRKVVATLEFAAERGYRTVDVEAMDDLIASLTKQRERAEAHHDEEHDAEYPHRLCRKCQVAGWLD